MFIKKIFENNMDNSVHRQFIRFSKGQYGNRAIINVKKGKTIKINTTFELANDLIYFITNLSSWFKVKGILISRNQIEGLEGKKKRGLFVYNIAKELKNDELRELVDKSYYALLDCVSGDNTIDLKIKKRLPKPGKDESKVNDKFCQLNLDIKYWLQVHKEFLFDLPSESKKVRIEHIYIIKNIKIPKELEKERDYEKIRLWAKRSGKLIRKAIVDGKEIVKEKEFTA